MTDALTERGIVRAVADAAATRIAGKVILGLRRMPKMLSGCGSVLRTMWDEICVQKWEGQWPRWDEQDQVVKDLVLHELGRLATYERAAIWLRTDAGSDWECEEPQKRAQDPVWDLDIVEYVTKEYVYEQATRPQWTARVEAYFDAPSWTNEVDL